MSMTPQELCQILSNDDLMEAEVLKFHNIETHIVQIDSEICCFVYRSTNNKIHVFVNSSLSSNDRKIAIIRELCHLCAVMENDSFIIKRR